MSYIFWNLYEYSLPLPPLSPWIFLINLERGAPIGDSVPAVQDPIKFSPVVFLFVRSDVSSSASSLEISSYVYFP